MRTEPISAPSSSVRNDSARIVRRLLAHAEGRARIGAGSEGGVLQGFDGGGVGGPLEAGRSSFGFMADPR